MENTILSENNTLLKHNKMVLDQNRDIINKVYLLAAGHIVLDFILLTLGLLLYFN